MSKWVIAWLCFCPLLGWAQNEPQVRSLHKAYFLSPGYEYEARLSSLATFAINPGLGFSFFARSSSVTGSETNFALYPRVDIGFRQYYNLARRQGRGKSIEGNSGNFITAMCSFSGGSIVSSGTIEVPERTLVPAVAWGLQRTYRRNFNLTLLLGLGYYSSQFNDRTSQGETLVAQVKLGYSFLKRD